MSYRIKVLLSKNNGDWRRRSAIIFKPNSTLTFNQFTQQCAAKVYPHHTITNTTPIKLFDITNIETGLIPIDDDDKNTPLSDLFEDHEIYRNCQILVILPLIHKQGIINPSNQQKNELKEEHELRSYLSNTNSSIASQSQYPSSISYPSSIHSTNKSFHTLSSIRKFNANNTNTQSHTRAYAETPLILAKESTNSNKNLTLSPFELPEIPSNNTIANVNKSPLIINDMNENSNVLLENNNVLMNNEIDDDMDELVCTLKNEDENIIENTLENKNNNKRTRKDFKPCINNKKHKKKKKKKRNSNDKQKEKNNGNKKRKRDGNVNGVSKPMGIMGKDSDGLPPKKRKLNNKQRDKTNDKQEMDASEDEGAIEKDIEVKNDNDKNNSEEESEYEEIVEYMMVEMKVGNNDGFDLHTYDKCVLTNMFDSDRLQSIKLERKNRNIEDEFQGVYCETLGSHMFFKQNKNNVSNDSNNANKYVDNVSLEYVEKSDIKCVFSTLKPKIYPS